MSYIIDLILKKQKKKKKEEEEEEVMEEIVFNVPNCSCSYFLLKFQERGLLIHDIYKGGNY